MTHSKVCVVNENGLIDLNTRMEVGKTYDIEVYYNDFHHPSYVKCIKGVKIYSVKEHGDYDVSYSTSDCYHWQGQSVQCMNISGWREVVA